MNFVKNLGGLSKHRNGLKLLAGFVQRSFTSGLGRNVESHGPMLSTLAKSSLDTSRFGGLGNNASDFYFSFRCHSSMAETSSGEVTQGHAQGSACKDINSENLMRTKTLMEIQVKNFFKSRLEYRAYTKDVVLENYFNPSNPVIVKGINNYAISVLKARFYINFCYPRIIMSVTESHVNEKDNLVIIHWKIDVLKQSMLFKIRNPLPNASRQAAENLSDHIFGISTFHVNAAGFIDKHTLRRVSGPLKVSSASDASTEAPKEGHKL